MTGSPVGRQGTGPSGTWAEEPGRLRSATRFRHASGDHPAVNRLAALAAQLLRAAHAQVSLLTDVQTVAGGTGLRAGAVGSEGPLGDSLCTVTAASGGPLVVPDATADVRVSALPPVLDGTVRAYLGVPLVARGAVVGAMCVFGAEPRAWTEEEVGILEQLAASVVSELELRALDVELETDRLLWELAIDAGGVGTFDWDLQSGVLSWDDRLVALFGYTRDSFDESIEAFQARVHPADRDRVAAALQGAIDTAGVYESEYRVLLPDGRTRWVGARGRALPDEHGLSVRVVGAAYDTSARRDSEARVARVLESMSAAFYSLDRGWRFTYVNAEAERLLGRPRSELLGGVIWELFPGTVGSAFESGYRSAMEDGVQVTFDAYYPAPLDGWYELRVWPGDDGISVYFLEISERRAAQTQLQVAAAQASLLAEVTSGLTETVDPEVQAERLARMVVPTLGTWARVVLLEDDPRSRDHDGVRTVATWPSADVADDGRAGAADAHGGPEEDGGLGETFELRARGRTLGRLVLGPDGTGTAGSRGPRAEEVVARAALALDNARLHRQRRHLVEELQRSMLTEPPQPDHLQVTVRYRPAADDVQVGGDWYDAFLQPDGATVLVIGDVVGHDSAAAAAMAQVRTLLRAVAADRGEAPARVLTRVDTVMDTLQVVSTATVVVARLEQTEEELLRGVSRLRWANAGHPPPVLLGADGSTRVLEADEADLLLGIDPGTGRADREVLVERGSTLLLYTDGLVERRGQSLDEGIALLRTRLEELADLPLDELCDRLLDRLVPERADDDVALVAVRLHPQDRPRPPEAGPGTGSRNVPAG
ncbi:SpoIIE family protein phosphatase [Aquipuribacter hungaricus]|uniref:SpoIIE family protein phosphatase n=1 Tax=Aquipuribacter hungaricus TaxID=545624 RepID=A0ABV7WK20_9MICO